MLVEGPCSSRRDHQVKAGPEALAHMPTLKGAGCSLGNGTGCAPSVPGSGWLPALTLHILTAALCREVCYPHFTAGRMEAQRN